MEAFDNIALLKQSIVVSWQQQHLSARHERGSRPVEGARSSQNLPVQKGGLAGLPTKQQRQNLYEMSINSNKFQLQGSSDQLHKPKGGQQTQFMNAQLSRKISVNHDPSEISDSESVLSSEDAVSKQHHFRKHAKQHAQGIEQSELRRAARLAQSAVHTGQGEVAHEGAGDFSQPAAGAVNQAGGGLFGFSMSHFFSQVKKSLWEGNAAGQPALPQSQGQPQEKIDEEEDNGEISPDSEGAGRHPSHQEEGDPTQLQSSQGTSQDRALRHGSKLQVLGQDKPVSIATTGKSKSKSRKSNAGAAGAPKRLASPIEAYNNGPQRQ